MAAKKRVPAVQAGPIFWLASVLRDRRDELSSWQALADQIDAANGNPKTPLFDRRKLARIVSGDLEVPLSPNELIALDRYLELYDQSLAKFPILEKPRILDTLTEGERVAVLLGARLREDRVDLSNWDVECMAEIMRGTGGLRKVSFDIQNVLLQKTKEAVLKPASRARWRCRQLLATKGPSLVCCGSPRSCHAAELMLAQMFDVNPFERAYGHLPVLPFHFVWGKKSQFKIPSRFAYTAEDLAALGNPAAEEILQGKSQALVAGGETYVTDQIRRGGGVVSYGVVVAQRQKGGQVWLVIAGLSGAATHAAARCVEDIHTNLPPRSGKGRESLVAWAVVQSTAEQEKAHPGTRILRVTEQKIIGGVRWYQG